MDRPVAGWRRAPQGSRNPTWLNAAFAATWLDGASAERLSRIVAAMTWAGANGVTCPEPVFAAPADGGAWLVARRLPGDPAERLEPEQLAAVLARVHQTPTGRIGRAEIEEPRPRGAATGADRFRTDCVFGHFDLFPDNILLRNGVVSGVVDWEFAGAGPRNLDVAIAALGASRLRPERARADLERLASAYEQAAGHTLDRDGLKAAYTYAARLFTDRRLKRGSTRPAGELLACADAVCA